MRPLYLLCFLAGCGRVGFGVIEGGGDAAAVEAPAFSSIDIVSELASTRFVDPDVSDDGFELVVGANRPSDGTLTIFASTRASLTAPWATPAELATIGTFSGVTDAELSSDRLTLWLGGGTAGETDIYESRRDAVGGDWSLAVRVDELSTTGESFGLSVTADGLCGLFTRVPAGDKALGEILESCRATASDPWGAPVAVAEINSDRFDGNPNISPDGLTLFFDSERDDPARRIYFTTRPSRDAAFAAPVEVDLGGDASDPTITADGGLLLFNSDRGGERRVYQALP